MGMKELASKIAKLEGKKTQARIGEVREILSILCDLIWSENEADSSATIHALVMNGKRRSKAVNKK